MPTWTHFYLIRIQFLGLHYHGWQKQPELPSIHGAIDDTLKTILNSAPFKTLGCSRTDAKVSAEDYVLELFVKNALIPEQLLHQLNKHLPSDISARAVEPVHEGFNIIQSARTKEYHYYFSFGKKPHPFSSPLMHHIRQELNVQRMKLAAGKFEGNHNLRQYTQKPSEKTELQREILSAQIVHNQYLVGNFIPVNSYVFVVKASGFLRYQVRMMMSALFEIGRGAWSIEDLVNSLSGNTISRVMHVAPPVGLVLHQVTLDAYKDKV
ncbi:MAG: tRNA pseudouridine(38-40) synthase TruA [Marinoscillum sp.]|uniref:tRNA pseudouridine synthase A n=1 Tax=Marinoscillum sp. TaxID=2024838 RepID=UPI0032FC8940